MRAPSALAVTITANSKLGPVSSTSVAQISCPDTCPLRARGCYAESGPQGLITRRLNRTTADVLAVAYEEAAAIDALPADRPLRLHVVGDASIDAAAQIVSAAADRYRDRGGMPAWTYTHGWRSAARSAWGRVSVLASCEHPEQVADA